MVSKGSKGTLIKVGLLVVLILLVILASPIAKEIFTTKSVNDTTIKSLNVSNVTSNSEEKNTESVTTSEVSLLPQIVNNLPTILGVLVPLIVIWWFRKEIRKLLDRNVTSVEVPGFKIGLAGYPEASEVGQRDGLLWRGKVTEMITISLFGTANISEGEIKKLSAKIEENLKGFREKIVEGIEYHKNQKPFNDTLKTWKEYANRQKEIGRNRLRLADIYNIINKKDKASHQVAEAGSNLKTAMEVLEKINSSTIVLKNPKDINKGFEDFVLFLDTTCFMGVCKHLEAYISEGTSSAPLYDAIEQYKQVFLYIDLFLENKKELLDKDLVKAKDLVKKIDQENGLEDDYKKELTFRVTNCCMYMGDAYLRLRNYEKAEKHLDELKEILTDMDKIKKTKIHRLELLLNLYITKGEIFYQQAYSDKADQQFEKAITIIEEIRKVPELEKNNFKPDYRYDISAYWWRIKNKYDSAKNLYANGLVEEAEKLYCEAIEIFESSRNNIEKAFNEGSALSFTGIAQVYYDLGLLYINIHDLDNAEIKFLEAIKILPEDPGLHIALGNVKFSKEDYKEAVKEYDHALMHEPGNPIALLNRAAAEQKLHKKVENGDGKDKKEPVNAEEDSGKEKRSKKYA